MNSISGAAAFIKEVDRLCALWCFKGRNETRQ